MDRWRRFTLAAGVLLSNGYLSAFVSGQVYRGPLKGACLPFISCFACPLALFSCPIGTLQHFAAIRAVPLLLIGGLGLLGVTLGRATCGWLCPFGLLQDLLHRLPGPKVQLPGSLTRLRYVVLVLLVLLVPYLTGAPWFSKLCPAGTLSAGIPWVLGDARAAAAIGEVGAMFLAKLLILGVFLGLFVMIKRPFCRTTCPFGAIMSLFNRVSVLQLRVAPGCRGCDRCRARCPVDLRVSDDPASRDCVRCLRCTACDRVSVGLRTVAPRPAPEPARMEYR